MSRGYTLQEMLVALVILGLVMGGLAALVHVYGRGMVGVGRDRAYIAAARRAQTSLRAVAESMAPLRSSGSEAATFEASARSVAFSCTDRQGVRSTCRLQIVADGDRVRLKSAGFDSNRTTALPGRSPDSARFRFLDATGVLTEGWPPGREERLGGILLELRIGEVWRAAAFEETLIDAAPDCQFDPVSVSCRQIDDPRERT